MSRPIWKKAENAMIISASRRTDIPACYADWFFRRLSEGYVLARNPVRYHQISRISLSPEAVDGIVFWTKNPLPMLDRLEALRPHAYYFQFTLTSYGRDIEPEIPSKNDALIPAFQRLADLLDPRRVIWRYDPVLLSAKYTMDYHFEYFYRIARRLKGYTDTCVLSFLDLYKNTEANLRGLGLETMDEAAIRAFAAFAAKTAQGFHMAVKTCAESIGLDEFGIGHGKCVDAGLLDAIRGYPVKVPRDPNQRPLCGCDASVDIGQYNTCPNGCKYCYANYKKDAAQGAFQSHDPASPLLAGSLGEGDVIRERT